MKEISGISVVLQDLQGGGAEKMMVNLCNFFVSIGIDTDLVLVRKEGPYLSYLDKKVKIVELNSRKVTHSLLPLIKYFRRKRPGIILSTLPNVNILVILAKKLSRVQCKLIIREANNISLNKAHTAYFSVKVAYSLIPFFYGYADEIVAISKGLSRELKDLLPKKNNIHTIYNPVLSSAIISMYDEGFGKDEEWFIEIDKPIIIATGRFVEQKDFLTLIKAFAEIKKECDFALVILGDGPKREILEDLVISLAIEDVYLPGFVSNPYKFYKAGEFFILSSKWEGFGNVLVEALYAGLKIVSTDCPNGPSEILEGGKYGSLVGIGDHLAIAQNVISIWSNQLHIQDDGVRYSSAYRVEEIGQQYLNLMVATPQG